MVTKDMARLGPCQERACHQGIILLVGGQQRRLWVELLDVQHGCQALGNLDFTVHKDRDLAAWVELKVHLGVIATNCVIRRALEGDQRCCVCRQAAACRQQVIGLQQDQG